MFKDLFVNRKLRKVQANTLYEIAKDVYREQETESIDIPYFIKAYNYTANVIKSGLLDEKLELCERKKG